MKRLVTCPDCGGSGQYHLHTFPTCDLCRGKGAVDSDTAERFRADEQRRHNEQHLRGANKEAAGRVSGLREAAAIIGRTYVESTDPKVREVIKKLVDELTTAADHVLNDELSTLQNRPVGEYDAMEDRY